MSWTELLTEYGYFAVFLGCILEGETILILAGFAIHQGYMSMLPVMAIAACGGAIGDQFFFFLGRYCGQKLVSRFPKLQLSANRINRLIERYHIILIIGVRFMYGFRIAGPVAIGMSKISVWKFIPLSLIGAVIWAILVTSMGYFFGQTLNWFLVDLKKHEGIVFLSVVVLAILIYFIYHSIKNRVA